MSYLLDTNICSAHIRRPAGLAHRFIQYSGRLSISTIVLAELYAGAHMLDNPTPILTAIGVVVFSPLLFVIHFVLIDQCSIPLWLAPREARQAVREAVSQDEGERVHLVNLDAIDSDHINVITNRRVLHLNSVHSGIAFEIALQEISNVEVDPNDERYLLIRDKAGQQHKMFFVGSPWGFYAFLSKEVDRRR